MRKSREDGVGQEQALCLSPVAITWVDLFTQEEEREGERDREACIHTKGSRGKVCSIH